MRVRAALTALGILPRTGVRDATPTILGRALTAGDQDNLMRIRCPAVAESRSGRATARIEWACDGRVLPVC